MNLLGSLFWMDVCKELALNEQIKEKHDLKESKEGEGVYGLPLHRKREGVFEIRYLIDSKGYSLEIPESQVKYAFARVITKYAGR